MVCLYYAYVLVLKQGKRQNIDICNTPSNILLNLPYPYTQYMHGKICKIFLLAMSYIKR